MLARMSFDAFRHALRLICALAAVTIAATARAQDPWPTGGYNLQRTGESPFVGCESGDLEFVGWGGAQGIAVGQDAIYVADGQTLTSYRFDGSMRWSLLSGATRVPTIGADGLVYFGEGDGICALDPQIAESRASSWSRRTDRTCLVWSVQTGSGATGSPLLLPDGTLITLTYDGILHALDAANGARRWTTFVTKQAGNASDPAFHNGRIYLGSDDDHLYALDATTGKVVWARGLKEDVNSGPAIGPDGTLYVTTSSWKMVAVAPNGTLKWTVSLAQVRRPTGYTLGPPAIDTVAGTVYVGGFDGLYAYGYDGKLKWRVASGRIWARPAIDRNGTVYVQSDADGFAYAVKPVGSQGVKLWERWAGKGFWFAHPAIGADGTVYFGGERLYAFRDGGTGRPTASFLRCSASEVVQGTPVGLRTSGRPGDAPLMFADFYLDVENPDAPATSGVLDDGDVLLNANPLPPDTTFDVNTSDFPPGRYTFFGQLTDEFGQLSNVVSYSIEVTLPTGSDE
jgi:large repetitive protein